MAVFDFIDFAAQGYKSAWRARRVLVRLSAAPLLIKLISFAAISALSLDTNYLRQGLLLIPSYFAEGWLVVQAIRLCILGEHRQTFQRGDQKQDAMEARARARNASAAIILYVLIKLTVSFFSGLVLLNQTLTAPGGQPPNPSPFMFFLSFAALTVMVWAFRFLWLYVPVALGYSLLGFLKAIKGVSASFGLIGTWLVCFIPLAFVLLMSAQLLAALFPGQGEEPGQIYSYGVIALQAIAETVIALVSSLGIAFNMQTLYHVANHKKRF